MAGGYHTDVVMGRLVGVGLCEFRIKWVCTDVAKNLVFDATNQWRDSKRGKKKRRLTKGRRTVMLCGAVGGLFTTILNQKVTIVKFN